MFYRAKPPLTADQRREMSVDLMQAYSEQLMNDEELATFKRYKGMFSMLSMGLAFAVPLGVAFMLRPNVFNVNRANVPMVFMSMGLYGLGTFTLVKR